jgi:hypothetical protein
MALWFLLDAAVLGWQLEIVPIVDTIAKQGKGKRD